MLWLALFPILIALYTLIKGPVHLLQGMALVSQTINWGVLGGHHDQTISARAWVEQDDPVWGVIYRTLNAIFFWQDDHCYESFLADLEFALEVQRWNRR